MVQALEQGVVPWRTPLTLAGPPRSMSTGNAYRGVNTWLLSLASRERGWRSPWFGTYAQIQNLGSQVRQGEKSTLVTFWKTLQIEERNAKTADVTTRAVPMLRRFRVFNAGQADNLPDRFYPEPGEDRLITRPQMVLDGYLSQPGAPGLRLDVEGPAYYDPASDQIRLPSMTSYRSPEHYYATAFHEAAHSTGHPSRLNRPGIIDQDAVGSIVLCGRVQDLARALAHGGRDECSAPVDGHDELSLPQDLHGVAHGRVGHFVLLGQCPLGWQLEGDLAGPDPAGDVIGDLDVGVVSSVRAHRRCGHVVKIDVI